MSNMFLKPVCDAEGNPMLVRDPVTLKPLDPAGEWKTLSQYWHRRLRDKEVIEASETATPAAPAEAPAATLLAGAAIVHPAGDPIT